jgi:hypothetical protein
MFGCVHALAAPNCLSQFPEAGGLKLTQSVGPSQEAKTDHLALDKEHQRVLNAVVFNLQQHYFDSSVAHQMADAMVAHESHGDDDASTTDEGFATLLTAQMREVSHDLHLQVLYIATPVPQSSPEGPAAYVGLTEKGQLLL